MGSEPRLPPHPLTMQGNRLLTSSFAFSSEFRTLFTVAPATRSVVLGQQFQGPLPPLPQFGIITRTQVTWAYKCVNMKIPLQLGWVGPESLHSNELPRDAEAGRGPHWE